MSHKKLTYMITETYRKEWSLVNAVQELVQNCLDYAGYDSTYTYDGVNLCIKTDRYRLHQNAFALGYSNKADPRNSIGGFGEGYKLALLVLTREGRCPEIKYGTQRATCDFEVLDGFSVKSFVINFRESDNDFDGTEFKFVITPDEWGMLKKTINAISDNPWPKPTSVDLLPHNPGEVYVNGLFISKEKDFKYGYNFAPNRIELGSDRQIMNSLGVAWETSKYWASRASGEADEILSMMTNEVLDVRDIHWHLTPSQATHITKAFSRKFGDVTIKPMGSSLGYGMSVGGSMYNTIKKSGYMQLANPHEEAGTPYSVLKEALESVRSHLRRDVKGKLYDILEQSKGWSKK